MNEETFKQRTKSFALDVIQLIAKLPKTRTADVISNQLLRSATSAGANYRAACRGKSVADVISKFCIVEEEADESIYWMELLAESKIVPQEYFTKLMVEANEITAMIVSSIKTLKKRKSN